METAQNALRVGVACRRERPSSHSERKDSSPLEGPGALTAAPRVSIDGECRHSCVISEFPRPLALAPAAMRLQH